MSEGSKGPCVTNGRSAKRLHPPRLPDITVICGKLASQRCGEHGEAQGIFTEIPYTSPHVTTCSSPTPYWRSGAAGVEGRCCAEYRLGRTGKFPDAHGPARTTKHVARGHLVHAASPNDRWHGHFVADANLPEHTVPCLPARLSKLRFVRLTPRRRIRAVWILAIGNRGGIAMTRVRINLSRVLTSIRNFRFCSAATGNEGELDDDRR